jgi:predicted nucleic acid-binding protein
MTARCFVDTNILLYAAALHPSDAAKNERARAVMAGPSVGLSAQVLQEFVANALAKRRLGISESAIAVVLDALAEVPTLAITRDLVLAAVKIREQHQLSYWDAAIVAAAQAMGCEILYSEGLSHGRTYGSVRVVNPFRDSD